MPASTLEPITGALRNAFHFAKSNGGGGRNGGDLGSHSLESGLHAVTKKTLLAPVSFDAPVKARQQQQELSAAAASSSSSSAPSYILLNPGYGSKNGDKGSETTNGAKSDGNNDSNADPTAPPKPKVRKRAATVRRGTLEMRSHFEAAAFVLAPNCVTTVAAVVK
jgi:hypothetical protein